jgi:hypothetical protein
MSMITNRHVSSLRFPALLALVCALPRVVALFWFPPDASTFHYWDVSGWLLASGALEAYGEVDTATEPLYPVFLAIVRAIAGDSLTFVALAQIALASVAGLLLYRAAENVADRRGATVAFALYAFDPYLVRQSVSPIEITLCVSLLIASIWSYSRRDSPGRAMATGLLLGLAVLTRFSLLPIALGTLGLLLRHRRRREAAAFAVAVTLTVGGWMMRTYMVNGALVPTRIGINLFISTCEYAQQVVPLRNVDLLVPWAYETIDREADTTRLTPTDAQRVRDDALFAKAVAFARNHPRTAVTLKLRNLGYSVAPMLLPVDREAPGAHARIEAGAVHIEGLQPRSLADHIMYSVSRAILLVGACVGLMRRRYRWGRIDGLLLVIAASIIGVQTIFFPTSRLLAPLAIVTIVYSGMAMSRTVKTLDP